MRANIAKIYISRIITATLCLIILVYNQYSYADIEKRLYIDGITGKKYTLIAPCGAKIITPEIAQEIIKALVDESHQTPVGCLVLGKRIFNPNAFSMIINALQTNLTVIDLVLALDNIGVEEAQMVADLLRKNHTLKKINLGGNNMGNGGTQVIAKTLQENSVLTKLDLHRNRIGIEGVSAIAEALKVNRNITRLNIAFNYAETEGALIMASALLINRTLIDLNIGGNNIGNEGMMAIISALYENKSLTDLTLSLNDIDAAGAKIIAEFLRTNPVLTRLDLANNHIGTVGMQAIAGSLLENRTLTALNLFDNEIGIEGAQAIANMLRVNNTLEELDLMLNNFGVEGIQAIVEAMVYNVTLRKIEADWLDRLPVVKIILKRNELIASIMRHITGSTLLLGIHPRTGMYSPLRYCSGDIVRMIMQMCKRGDFYSEDFYNLIMSGTREELLRYLTIEELERVNEIRGLQIQIYEALNWQIPEGLQLVEAEIYPVNMVAATAAPPLTFEEEHIETLSTIEPEQYAAVSHYEDNATITTDMAQPMTPGERPRKRRRTEKDNKFINVSLELQNRVVITQPLTDAL